MSFQLLHILALSTLLNSLDVMGKQKLDLMAHNFSFPTDSGSSLGRFWSRARTSGLAALVCAPLGPSLWLDLAGKIVQPTC